MKYLYSGAFFFMLTTSFLSAMESDSEWREITREQAKELFSEKVVENPKGYSRGFTAAASEINGLSGRGAQRTFLLHQKTNGVDSFFQGSAEKMIEIARNVGFVNVRVFNTDKTFSFQVDSLPTLRTACSLVNEGAIQQPVYDILEGDGSIGSTSSMFQSELGATEPEYQEIPENGNKQNNRPPALPAGNDGYEVVTLPSDSSDSTAPAVQGEGTSPALPLPRVLRNAYENVALASNSSNSTAPVVQGAESGTSAHTSPKKPAAVSPALPNESTSSLNSSVNSLSSSNSSEGVTSPAENAGTLTRRSQSTSALAHSMVTAGTAKGSKKKNNKWEKFKSWVRHK